MPGPLCLWELHDALGPYLPVDLTPRCLAARPEADLGSYCSILAMRLTAVRTTPTSQELTLPINLGPKARTCPFASTQASLDAEE
jgi:hypothetical protein